MTTEERFDRMERVLDRVVDTQLQVDTTLLTLADSHIKTQDELQKLAAEVNKTQESIASLERQLQAYLRTRPQ